VLVAAGCSDERPAQTPTSAGEELLADRGHRGGDDDREDRHLRGSVPFSAAQIFIEYNSSASDAGIQVFLDAEDWKRVGIVDDNGKDLLAISTGGGMRELGLTELRFEGAEPGPTEVLDAFPEGEYEFTGVTVERQRLTGSAFLSHDIPDAPMFTPSNGEPVDLEDTEIEWTSIAGVDRYQVIVESDANNLVLEVTVSSSTTSLRVPPTFLAPNTLYKAEVLAIAPNGNRTLTEGTFVTGP
jgi:hypothetical protein